MSDISSICSFFSSDGEDFIQITSNMTFTSSAHTQTEFILFIITDDDLEEPTEEFLISVGSVTAKITITDDDGELYNT